MDDTEPPVVGAEDEEWAVLEDARDSSRLRYLASPPESSPVVVSTNLQVLPLGDLTWPDFERLCYRLSRRAGEVEDCLFYGIGGQAQYGIDIFVWRNDGGYSVIQCKRYQEFTGNHFKKAVDKFLDGRWTDRADRFVLATSSDLAGIAEDVKTQVDRLKESGIAFEAWDFAAGSRTSRSKSPISFSTSLAGQPSTRSSIPRPPIALLVGSMRLSSRPTGASSATSTARLLPLTIPASSLARRRPSPESIRHARPRD